MCLVGVASVGSVATSGVGSAAGSGVGILSKFFLGNNLLLKLLRTFSLVLNNNLSYLKKTFFQMFLYLFQIFFNSIVKLFCLKSAFSNDKYPSSIYLKKTVCSEYFPKLLLAPRFYL